MQKLVPKRRGSGAIKLRKCSAAIPSNNVVGGECTAMPTSASSLAPSAWQTLTLADFGQGKPRQERPSRTTADFDARGRAQPQEPTEGMGGARHRQPLMSSRDRVAHVGASARGAGTRAREAALRAARARNRCGDLRDLLFGHHVAAGLRGLWVLRHSEVEEEVVKLGGLGQTAGAQLPEGAAALCGVQRRPQRDGAAPIGQEVGKLPRNPRGRPRRLATTKHRPHPCNGRLRHHRHAISGVEGWRRTSRDDRSLHGLPIQAPRCVRPSPEKQHVGHDAHGPDVHLPGIYLSPDHLGCHEPRRACETLELASARVADLFGKAEVAQLDDATGRRRNGQEVGKLDVPVHDARCVAHLDSGDHVTEYRLQLRLRVQQHPVQCLEQAHLALLHHDVAQEAGCAATQDTHQVGRLGQTLTNGHLAVHGLFQQTARL
mmetsp:Transcript_83368/g.241234  ORF Transcript_83368/g.241234 Transcript_83368/m.241234 type:complete len:432 (+) Transcript_83368:150-1445(+)